MSWCQEANAAESTQRHESKEPAKSQCRDLEHTPPHYLPGCRKHHATRVTKVSLPIHSSARTSRVHLTLLDMPDNAALHAHRGAVDARRRGGRQEGHRGRDLVRLQEALQQRRALVLREVGGGLRLRAAACIIAVYQKTQNEFQRLPCAARACDRCGRRRWAARWCDPLSSNIDVLATMTLVTPNTDSLIDVL